jgi:hypothetical protein
VIGIADTSHGTAASGNRLTAADEDHHPAAARSSIIRQAASARARCRVTPPPTFGPHARPPCYSLPMSPRAPSSDESQSRRKGPSVGVRVAVSGGAGALSAFVVAIVGPWRLIPLFGWDIAALVFVSWMWHSLWSLDAADTAEQRDVRIHTAPRLMAC